MAELKHTFSQGKMNKDLDERIVPNGQYRDAMNIQVSTSEGSDVGAVQNIFGNSEIVVANLPAGAVCVGSIADEKNDTLYYFIAGDTVDCILQLKGGVVTPVLVDTVGGVLSFDQTKFITGINVIDGLLLWTDGITEPKKINIQRSIDGTTSITTHTKIHVNGVSSANNVTEEYITNIKRKPNKPPTLDMSRNMRDGDITGSVDLDFDSGGGVLYASGDNLSFDLSGKNWEVGDTLYLNESGSSLTEDHYLIAVIVTENTAATPNTYKVDILSIGSSVNTGSLSYDIILDQSQPVLFEKKFPRFATRWKYEDGEYSAFSPFSDVAFLPGIYSYHATKEAFNEGMTNTVRTLLLKDLVPYNIPEDVVQVDILYKEESSNTIYVVDNIIPTDANWTADGTYSTSSTKGSYEIKKENIHFAVPSNQLLRPWDNLPTSAKAQDVSGNRVIYGNYKQGNDITTAPTIAGGVEKRLDLNDSTQVFTRGLPSVKSLRDYQLGVVFGDKYGRETPVFTSEDAFVSVDYDEADSSNRILATPKNFPNWADYYKFYIKETSNEYYNLVSDRVYRAKEEENLWLSFPSVDRNKISEESYIVLKKQVNDNVAVPIENKFKVIAIKNEAPAYVKDLSLKLGTGTGGGNPSSLYPSNISLPITNAEDFTIDKSVWIDTDNGSDLAAIKDPMYLEFLESDTSSVQNRSGRYDVISVTEDSGNYKIKLSIPITSGDGGWITSASSVINSDLQLRIYIVQERDKQEFEGRFFVKILANSISDQYLAPQFGASTFTTILYSDDLFALIDNGINNTTLTSYGYTSGTTNAVHGDNVTETPAEWLNVLEFGTGSLTSRGFIDQTQCVDFQPTNSVNASNALDLGSNTYRGLFKAGASHVTSGGINVWTDETDFYTLGKVYLALSFSRLGVDLHSGHPSTVNAGPTGIQSLDWENLTVDATLQEGTQTTQNAVIIANQWRAYAHPAFIDTNYITKTEPGNSLRFGGFLTQYRITKRKIIRSYNHTPFKDYGNGDSVMEAYNTLETTPNPITADETTFLSKLQDFGLASNRKITYLLELEGDPIADGLDIDDFADATTPGKIHFVESFIDENVSIQADESPIWETEPKGTDGLDIYYEASESIPTTIDNTSGASNERFAPLGIKVRCSKTGSNPGGQPLLVSWNGNEIEFAPSLVADTGDRTISVIADGSGNVSTTLILDDASGLSVGDLLSEVDTTDVTAVGAVITNITANTVTLDTSSNWVDDDKIKFTHTNSASSLADQDIMFKNKTIKFYKDDNSFVAASIFGVTDVTGGKINKVTLNLTNNKATGLSWSNCYSFGNGVESDRIRDDFNETQLSNGVRASTTLEIDYKEEHKKTGLIYSGIYNSTSGVNNLNQFIAAEKITKDLNPTYGSIQKLHARDTDLITLCEDKCLRVLSNKDAVYNADGNPQLTANNNVLGQTIPFTGEYGISQNPESFASESYRVYFTDKVRGAVLRLSSDGLTPISDAGMTDYFRTNLKTATNLIGSYDTDKDDYNLTIGTSTTATFSEDVRGWVSFKSFIQENGVSMANDYYTFKNGKIYKHHDSGVDRNTFYGDHTPSSITALLNDASGSVKSFNTINYEGSQAKVDQGLGDGDYYNLTAIKGWEAESIITDKQEGSINEFIEKEGKWFNYIKGETTTVSNIDTSEFSFQGIGKFTSIV